jgi:uncharacterized membrane protein YedE/YeeE
MELITSLLETVSRPWPWYIGGACLGIMVPILLLLGNKTLGLSSTLRHMCAAIYPGRIPALQYDWKKEGMWNLFFAAGIVAGGFLGAVVLADPQPPQLAPQAVAELNRLGVHRIEGLLPTEFYNWQALGTLRGWLTMVVGGFLIGFGTRLAGGCTSGHAIMGVSALQWPSMVAAVAIFGGIIFGSWFIIPLLFRL